MRALAISGKERLPSLPNVPTLEESGFANLNGTFNGGAWAALGASYYEGGRTTVNGVRNDDKLGNSRTVVILALPVDRQHSIKVSASKGLHTRIGTDFKTFGVAWQYRWGAGF